MSRLARTAGWIVEAMAGLGVAAFGFAALVTVADIGGRLVGLPVAGVVELVQLGVMAGAWLSIPYAFLTAAHVSLDFGLDAMPRRMRRAFEVAIAAASVGLIALMWWYSWQTFAVRTMFGDRSQQLGIPIEVYWYPLFTGMLLSLVAIAARALTRGGD